MMAGHPPEATTATIAKSWPLPRPKIAEETKRKSVIVDDDALSLGIAKGSWW
jgi:hypothetical protein